MKDLIVIIPLHKYDKETGALLSNAVASVPEDTEIRISCKKGLANSLNKAYKANKNVKVLENEGEESDFCTLVNKAVGDTTWFSILEYDDEYTPIWFDNFRKYVDFYSDISIFVPMEDLVDATTDKFAGIGNEAPWASSFSNEIGYIDNDCLKNFFDFYMTGSIFRTDDWKEVGGLKPSIKLTFWYEFLRRATYKGKKVYVIPKIGYTHLLGRKDSLIEGYKATITDKESNFWIDVARKEYFFKEERDKSKYIYDPNKNAEDEE